MKKFEEELESVQKSMAGSVGASKGGQYVADVQSAVDHSTTLLDRVGSANAAKGVDFLKGDVAEAWHAGTLLVDAARRGHEINLSSSPDQSGVVAVVPRSTAKGGADVVYGDDSAWGVEAQLKYYKDGNATAKAISTPEYRCMEKVVPSDQLEQVRQAADREAARNRLTRPDVADDYANTAKMASDRLRTHQGDESHSLSEPEARDIASEIKQGEFNPSEHGLSTEAVIELYDVLRESGGAAAYAAAISAAITATPHLWRMASDLLDGEDITTEQFLSIGKDVAKSAGGVGLRAGVSAALTASCRAGLLGEGLKVVPAPVIGAATVVAVNAIGYATEMARGQISGAEFAARCSRDVVTVSAGVVGAVAGQAIIPVPVLGAVIGNLVGSIAGGLICSGTETIVVGVCVDTGWSFLGIVSQDYEVPPHVLARMGIRTFQPRTVSVRTFKPRSMSIRTITPRSLSITPLRRGVIACRAVGYVS